MKILALTLFTLLVALAVGSHWSSAHNQMNSQVGPGAPTVSDVQSGLEMVMPVLDRQGYLDTQALRSGRSRSSLSVGGKTGIDGETDDERVIDEDANACDEDIQTTRSMLNRLQTKPLEFNGIAGYELTLLIQNVHMCNITMVLHLRQAEFHSRDSVEVAQLIRELNDVGMDLLKVKQIEELWFMQYVKSTAGELTNGSEADSSETKALIQKISQGIQAARHKL